MTRRHAAFAALLAALAAIPAALDAADGPGPAARPAPASATIDGSGPDWSPIGEADLVAVNGGAGTWAFDADGQIRCSGEPVGVIRTKKAYTNFELVARWRHRKPAGNSGFFLWTSDVAIEGIKPGELPRGGIEVQVLDTAYATEYEKQEGRKPDWFTTDGDVFPVGTSKMTPFAPTSPNGQRSFPRKRLSKGVDEWNHYYIRAINGEVRLWVNGEEVSGGNRCTPARGYLCLESEGSPVEFRDLRIRELP